ncbi:MAG: hypothetical protein HYY06_16815 [Deltaproteobacteria bacterium]|nr:hypothetical protein [Deltaproteobacteria bacterium]
MRFRGPWAALAAICLVTGASATSQAQTNIDFLVSQLNQRATQFASGMTLFGPIQTGRLRTRGKKNFNFVLTAGQCYRIIGVGDANVTDLDIFLRVRSSTVAQDTATDNYPVVSYCPPATTRVQVRVSMYAGGGEFALGVFSGSGAGGGVVAPGPIVDTNAVAARLSNVARSNAAGYVGIGAPIVGSLMQNASQTVNVSLVQGVCYKFIGVGGAGVQDLDLHIMVGGARVAQDTATDDFPIASYCAPTHTIAQVQVFMYRGAGQFAYQTFQSGHAGPQAIVPLVQGNDYIANRMRQIQQQYAQGRNPVSPLMRGSLQTSGTQDFSVTLQSGHCYTVVGVGDPSVTDLDMFLFDGAGTQVAQDQATDNFPIVQSCPSVPGNFRVQVKMYSGYGNFGLQIFGN